MKSLFNGIGKPIKAIRVFKGSILVNDIQFEISSVRGA